jgi:Na+-translocating ferredoxin:NAD+ oxidoreductase subunit B
MSETKTRRQFIETTCRVAGVTALAGGAVTLIARRASAHAVFQVDPLKCAACDICRTACVLPLSAVKAVNEFSKCGYCRLCPAYMDVASAPDEVGIPSGKVCPQDALKRRVVGREDPDDPNNNYYEYTVDEARCTGCGKCVKACKPPAGNGSLRLEIRYNRCLTCNECSILVACPEAAIVRVVAPGLSPIPREGEHHDV